MGIARFPTGRGPGANGLLVIDRRFSVARRPGSGSSLHCAPRDRRQDAVPFAYYPLAGFVVRRERSGRAALVGVAIVCAAGLYTLVPAYQLAKAAPS